MTNRIIGIIVSCMMLMNVSLIKNGQTKNINNKTSMVITTLAKIVKAKNINGKQSKADQQNGSQIKTDIAKSTEDSSNVNNQSAVNKTTDSNTNTNNKNPDVNSNINLPIVVIKADNSTSDNNNKTNNSDVNNNANTEQKLQIKQFNIYNSLAPGRKNVVVVLDNEHPENYDVTVGGVKLKYDVDTKEFISEVLEKDAVSAKADYSKVIISKTK